MAAIGGALSALLLLPVPASAHAGLVVAEPAGGMLAGAPATVRLSFSEPVTPAGRGIAVWSPSGRQVGGNLAQPAPATLVVTVAASQPGTYLVVWTVIASDTHPSRGSFTFSVAVSSSIAEGVGVPTGDVGAVSPLGLLLQVAGRWLHFAGYALGFGPLAFGLLVLGPKADAAAVDSCRRLAMLGIGILVAAEPLMLLAQVLSLGGLDGQIVADVLASPAGRILALRLGAAILLWALLGAASLSGRRQAWAAALVLGVVLAVVDASSSHALKGLPAAAGLLLNAAHEVGMGAWLGGLAALAQVLAWGHLERKKLISRFGRFAAGAALLLLASGAVLALLHLDSPVELLTSTYGLVVLVKVAGVGAALATAYLGLRTGRSWRAEAIALGGVLALAGLLVSLPPPR